MAAVEGLPGAGKTSFAATAAMLLPEVTVLPELILPLPKPPVKADVSFFASNDLAKITAARLSPLVLLDRTWFSTVAYVIARERMLGRQPDPLRTVDNLYGRVPRIPDLCIFIDSSSAHALGFSQDGFFPYLHFRALLRAAYLELFREFVPRKAVCIVPDNSQAWALPRLQREFAAAKAGQAGLACPLPP